MTSAQLGIVCAMQEESALIIDRFGLSKASERPFEVYIRDDFVLVASNIGKVAAAAATTYLIEQYNPALLCNIGIAGALDNRLEPAEVFIIDEVLQHDAYMPIESLQSQLYTSLTCAIPESLNQQPRKRLVTGDQFIDSASKVQELAKRGDLVDMEGYAVAYVANAFDKTLVMIKGISDRADGSAQDDVFENLVAAMDRSVSLLGLLVELDD